MARDYYLRNVEKIAERGRRRYAELKTARNAIKEMIP
jgi:hypothetical protein